ncbi:MAG TPA: hypothetical protein P5163_00985, partial [Rubrivivax sp.]|nr:hypothetical protein [Rubrivivax sp.]
MGDCRIGAGAPLVHCVPPVPMLPAIVRTRLAPRIACAAAWGSSRHAAGAVYRLCRCMGLLSAHGWRR